MIDQSKTIKSSCGIGHIRWATHDEPSAINFVSSNKSSVVKNLKQYFIDMTEKEI